MSDKKPLHSFSKICKSKPVHYYTITEQEIKSLQHNNRYRSSFHFVGGIVLGVAVSIFIRTILHGGDWKNWTCIIVASILYLYIAIWDKLAKDMLCKIWDNVKQVSEVICEKK